MSMINNIDNTTLISVADNELLVPKNFFNLPDLEMCGNEQEVEELQSFTEEDLFSHSETSSKETDCDEIDNTQTIDQKHEELQSFTEKVPFSNSETSFNETERDKIVNPQSINQNSITESSETSDKEISKYSHIVNTKLENLVIEIPKTSNKNLKESNENDIDISERFHKLNTELRNHKKQIEIYDDIIEIPEYFFSSGSQEILNNEPEQNITQNNSQLDDKYRAVEFYDEIIEIPEYFFLSDSQEILNSETERDNKIQSQFIDKIKANEMYDNVIEIPEYFFSSGSQEILNNDKEDHDVESQKQIEMNSPVGVNDSNFESKLEENKNNFVTENKNKSVIENKTNLDLDIKMLEQIKLEIETKFKDPTKLKVINEIIESMRKKIINSASTTFIPTSDPKPRNNEEIIELDINRNNQSAALKMENSQNNCSANTSDTQFIVKIEEQQTCNVKSNKDFKDEKHHKITEKTLSLSYQQPFNQSKSEFEILKEFENSDLIKNDLAFFCPACGSEIQPLQGIILNECRHSFCYGCLIDYVKNNGGAGELMCPINEECDGFVLPQEINSLLSISLKIGKVNKNTSASKLEEDIPWWEDTPIEKKKFTSTLNDENIILEHIIEVINSEQNTNVEIENISQKNKTNYEILMDLEKTSLVPNQFIFDCSLCEKEIDYLKGAVLKECLHCFCLNCLIDYVCKNNNNVSCFACPFVQDDAQCECFLQPEEIKNLHSLSLKIAIEPFFKEEQEIGLAQIVPEKNNLDSGNRKIIEQENKLSQVVLDKTKNYSTNQNELKTTEILLKPDQEEEVTQFVLEGAKTHATVNNEIIDNNNENQNTKSQCVNSPMHCADYKYLMELEEVDLIVTTDKFKCAICLDEIDPGKGVRIKDCLHEFCQRCLIDTINHTEDPTSVNCPFFDGYKCDGILLQREIKELLSTSDFMKYLEKNIKRAELGIKNTFHCLTPNCENWWIIEENILTATCDICNYENCIKCKHIHSGLTCEQYSDRLLASNDKAQEQKSTKVISDMIVQKNAMICPNCQNVVEKVIGCDAITCKCKTELCWATKGPRWGPKGKGDTSGGCRCNVNGPCTPTCNYCH